MPTAIDKLLRALSPSGADVEGDYFLRAKITDWLTALDNTIDSVSIAGKRATYSYSGQISLATNATDFLTLTGSATKTVKVRKVQLQFVNATPALLAGISFTRRSAANTGGTSTAPTAASRDTNNAAATAVVTAYTANPTGLGTAVAVIDGVRPYSLDSAAADGSIVASIGSIHTYGDVDDQPLTLRGVTDILAFTANGALAASTTVNVGIVWTED